ncbi:sensor histidine kinase [Roseivirga sp.]|uniref:sensor histidine kinase n=1 Tax=Roseivirga sp. TaxID=1964215 RepID=UPI003B8AC99C
MQRTKDWSIALLIVSGILVMVLMNLGTFKWVFSEDFSSLDILGRQRLHFGLLSIIVHFILFQVLGLFHFQWKDRLIRASWSNPFKVLVIVLLSVIVFFGLTYLQNLYSSDNFITIKKRIAFEYFIWNNLPIALIAIAEAYFLILWRKVRRSEVEKIQLKEEKSNAELAALKEQISPHFFFNTLSSLSSIVRNEQKEAGLEFIQELSNTYRYTLASKREELVQLKEELDFVKSYLFLLGKRFGKKLKCEIEVSGAHLSKKVPPMSIQLLVENATQHNVITKDNPLFIKVYIEDENICVVNNLREKETSEGLGMGLSNLSQRYRLIAKRDIVILKEQNTFEVKIPLL